MFALAAPPDLWEGPLRNVLKVRGDTARTGGKETTQASGKGVVAKCGIVGMSLVGRRNTFASETLTRVDCTFRFLSKEKYFHFLSKKQGTGWNGDGEGLTARRAGGTGV